MLSPSTASNSPAINLSDQEQHRIHPDRQAAILLDSIGVRMIEVLERADACSHDPTLLTDFAEGNFLSTMSKRDGIVSNRFLLKGATDRSRTIGLQ